MIQIIVPTYKRIQNIEKCFNNILETQTNKKDYLLKYIEATKIWLDLYEY